MCFSRSSDKKPSDLLGKFSKISDTPASRCVPSYTSGSVESSVSDINIGDTSLATSTRSGLSSSIASIPAGSSRRDTYLSSSVSGATLPSVSGASGAVDLRHRGYVDDTLLESSSDDETYESPDEFVDALETPATAPTPAESASASSVLSPTPASFTPVDAQRLSEPVATDNNLQADLRQVWYAINLFLNSHFAEAEAICARHKDDRLYYALGTATLNSISALMSFEPEELARAVDDCKKCLHIADKDRNNWASSGGRGYSWTEKIAGGYSSIAKGSSLTVEIAQRMSPLQKHAELAYAECLLM